MIPPVANRFVAGETPAEALERAQALNDRNVKAIVNLLGEHYDDREDAEADARVYRRLVDDIADANLGACVSVKPSQLGLDVGADVFEDLLEGIVQRASRRGVFVWIDMEDHTTTDATLDAYERVAREYADVDPERVDEPGRRADGGDRATVGQYGGTVGVCLQANLKRTSEDLRRLADVPGKVRLVKGAYDEPASIAYEDSATVNEAYRALLEEAFERYDGGVAVGSHDPEMIDYAIDLHEEHGTDFEIQMLMGVREDAQFDLAEAYEVWQYVPYGNRWLSYFYRRVMERKENLRFAARAVLGR